jgi:hypothetical protein
MDKVETGKSSCDRARGRSLASFLRSHDSRGHNDKARLPAGRQCAVVGESLPAPPVRRSAWFGVWAAPQGGKHLLQHADQLRLRQFRNEHPPKLLRPRVRRPPELERDDQSVAGPEHMGDDVVGGRPPQREPELLPRPVAHGEQPPMSLGRVHIRVRLGEVAARPQPVDRTLDANAELRDEGRVVVARPPPPGRPQVHPPELLVALPELADLCGESLLVAELLCHFVRPPSPNVPVQRRRYAVRWNWFIDHFRQAGVTPHSSIIYLLLRSQILFSEVQS